jgi:hypothetical protein
MLDFEHSSSGIMYEVESWRPIEETQDHYEISDRGRVCKIKEGRRILLKINFSGPYAKVGLYPPGVTGLTRQIHKLVCEAFHGHPQDFRVVRHLNGDRYDNRAINLIWGTPEENSQDAILHGTHRGSSNGRSKLTEDQVSAIKNILSANPKLSRNMLAKALGVTRTAIGHIEKGRQWSHVDECSVDD